MSQQEDERHYEYKQLVVQVTDVMLKILKKQNKMKQKKKQGRICLKKDWKVLAGILYLWYI